MKQALLSNNRIVILFKHVLPAVWFKSGCLSGFIFATILLKLRQLFLRLTWCSNLQENKSAIVRSSLVTMLFLLVISTSSMAEGSKQLEPTTPTAANGSLGLALYSGGWTANGQRNPFATVGCAEKYRLHVHISDPSTEIIYFGFKQQNKQPLLYRFRDPDGIIVPGYNLKVQPAVGTNGYITNWTQAVAGPKFGAMNPTGYTPLVLTPTKAGDYYLEFAQDAAGNTNAMNGTIIEYIDVSVYEGNNVKNGRLWSRAWQFSDMIAGGDSPQTNFFILSNDSIVTKLNINRWQGGHFMFYCNQWGTVSSGNWYADRFSIIAPSAATWPGDLPEYKIFLNDPDNIVYPTGTFGKICDVATNSHCDGSIDFEIKVDKPGKIELSIDIDPKGTDNGEDVKLNADLLGSPGCTTWETIPWDGENGFGQLLANGATLSVNVDYLNGLTHLPIYDIENNSHGIMVDLVRPVPGGSSKMNIYWDDSKVTNCGPVCVNSTGCQYASAATACHTWPATNQGNLVIYNSWWYYQSNSAAVSPVVKRFPQTPTTAASGPTSMCAGQTNVVYTIAPILYAESYVWTLPDGTTEITTSNSISLNFPTPASGGLLTVHGENENCGIGIDAPTLLITIKPAPVVTATQSMLSFCSGATTNIALSSTVLNTTYTWTASAPSSISGFSNGSSNPITQTLTNTSNAKHDVTYVITPVSGGCTGTPIIVIVTVQPSNIVTSVPLTRVSCSGSPLTINLSATLPGTNFSWTASGVGITGYSNGSGDSIYQTLINTATIPRNAIYLVSGILNGCTTSTTTYTVTVNPVPILTNNPRSSSICSGAAFNLALTSNQAGSSYTWTTIGTSGISGYSSGSGKNISSNLLIKNNTNSPGTVTYTIIPTALNCAGNPVDYTLTVNPLPVVALSGPSPVCLNSTGNVYATDASMTNYIWSVVGGTITAGGNTTNSTATVTWNSSGAKSISGNYTNTNGCVATNPTVLPVTVNLLPVIALNGPSPVCLNSTGNIYTTDAGMTNYLWTVVGGTITAGGNATNNSATVTWNSSGAKSISVNYTNPNGCVATNPKVIPVTVNPLPIVALSGPSPVCLNSTGNIYTTDAGMTNYLWTIVGGTITAGGNATNNSATVTWNSSGGKSISVNYTNSNGCVATNPTIFPVTVNPLPVVPLSGPSPVCLNSTGNVYSTDAGMSGYVWTIAGGTITAGGNATNNAATVTWNSSGAKTISVNYTNLNGCVATNPTIFPVTVNPLPVVALSGPSPVCLNSTGNIYTTDAGMTNYVWTVVGGTITAGGNATNNSATITWNSSGGKSISVNYANSNGCVATNPTVFPVTVNPLPVVALSGPSPVCLNSTGNFYSTNTGMTNYVWIVAGGTITAGGNATNNSATVTWNSSGTKSISVNYSNPNGCVAANPTVLPVTVNPLPVVALNGPSPVCLNSTGNIYTTDAGMTSYVWTVTGGIITAGGNATSNTITVTWNSSGAKSIRVNYTNSNGCVATNPTILPVIVNLLPFVALSGPSPVCLNSTGNIYTTDAGMTNYVWSVVGGIISAGGNTTSNTATVTWNASGAKSISVNYTNLNGCIATNPTVLPVTVNPLPVVALNGPSAVCLNSTGNIYSTDAGMTNYVWTITGGTITAGGNAINNSATITWISPGSKPISVSYTDPNGCVATNPTLFTVTVNPLPVVALSGPSPVCSNSSGNVYTTNPGMTAYAWTVAGGTISNGGSPTSNAVTVTWDGAGPYSVGINYKNANGCSATTTKALPVIINPLPEITSSLSEAVCSGQAFNYIITGDLAGTNFAWSRTAVVGISNPAVSGSLASINETLINSTNKDIDVLYTLTPYVIAPSFCTGITQMLIVKVRALPQINAGNDQTIFYGTYTSLKGTASGGTGALNYTWASNSYIGSGINTLTPKTINLTSNRTYTLTVNDVAGCTATDQMMVNVVGTPLAAFPTPVSTTICAGESATIDANASGGAETYTYSWASVPAGFTGAGPSITVLPKEDAQYFVTVSDGFNSITASVTVTVLPLPLKFVLTGGGSSCAGVSGVEVGLAGSQSGVSYQLQNNGNPAGMPVDGTGSAISFGNQTTGGIYSVIAKRTSTGCVQSMGNSVPVSITASPVSFFSSKQDCSNALVNFSDLSNTLYGYIAEWVWDFGDGIYSDIIRFPDEPNISHLYNSPGTYKVTLKVTSSFGCISSATIPVKVIEAPVANFQYIQNCSGLGTSFRDASYANGPGNIVQYWWDFGDTSTGIDNFSVQEEPTHIYSAPGTYNVKYVVRNFNNCTDTIVKPVLILTPVPVDFVHGYTCLDSKSNFNPDTAIMNTTSITSWEWNFGDGVINNQQNTTHIFSDPGSYQVTLTVNNISGCAAYKTRTVVVNPLPVAMFKSTQHPCANTPLHFDDVSATYAGHIIKWKWDFGDGKTLQILNPSNPDTDHSYSFPGTYLVSLTITSSDSCTAVSQQTVVIFPVPVANFDYDNGCQGTSAQFNDLSQTNGAGIITGWIWNFGDGASGSNNTSGLQNPLHKYTASGIYHVSITAISASGCSSTVVKTFTITESPVADFNYDNNCAASTIRFSPAASVIVANVATWYWSFGDGSTSIQADPQYSYSMPGNYDVSLTITSTTGCQSTISQSIAILPAPIAGFSTDAPACSQHQVAFTNQSSAPAGNIIRWEYNFGDGKIAVINFPGNPNVSHTYITSGNFKASLTIVTDNNCPATTSKNIKVIQGPLANFDFGSSCLGSAVQFNDLSQGNPKSWAWNFGDSGSGAENTSTQQNPPHTFLKAGNYQVTLLVENANGCKDKLTRTLTIAARPEVDFSFNTGCANDTVHFNSLAYAKNTNISSWLWDFGDNTTSVDADPYHIYSATGVYTVSLTITNQNGCTNVKTHKVQVTTAPIANYTHSSLLCSGTAVLFTDFSSTPAGTITSWNWNFDDGTTLTVNAPSYPNITHVFKAAGLYQVSLIISTSNGCYANYTSTIKINDASVTAFTFANGCDNSPTSFTDRSQAAGGYSIEGWNWNFGDPASGISNNSAFQNPQHVFSGPGTYNVTLTTENREGCTNSMVRTITITPENSINFTNSAACKGSVVSFGADTTTIDKSEISSYLWDFGDGTSSSTLAEPGHLFADAGNYTVTLTVTRLADCKSSVSKIVTIHNWPVAQFTTNGNCTANNLEFTDKSFSPDADKIAAWAWNFGVTNSSSSLQNPSYSYLTEGTYNVRLTIASQSGCTAVKVMPVTVIAAPTAVFSSVAESCHNGSVLFIDKSVSTGPMINGWKWEFAPGVYSTLQNPVHVFGDADSCFNVKLTVFTANGCSNTVLQQVCMPTGIKVEIDYTQACIGETTWFTTKVVEPAGATIASYKWNFGDPATGFYNESRLTNPQHTFSKSGTFVISLKTFDNSSCSTTKYMSVIVDALPNSAFSYSGGNCDSLVKFKDETSGTKIARWIWKFGDGKSKIIDAPANPNVTHYYANLGVYQVTLITRNEAGCYDTITKEVRRTPCISAAFTVNDPIGCQKRSMKFFETSFCDSPIASWHWVFGDGTSATYTSPQPIVEHTYAVAGTYTVKMVVAAQMVGGLVTDSAVSQVSVNPVAKAAYKWQDVCVGTSTSFDNLSQDNNTTIKSYLWNFGDPVSKNDTASVKNPEYKYNLSGVYDVKLVVTNTLGCVDSIVKKVNIFAGPFAGFFWNNNCEAKPVYFTDNSEAASSTITNWNWKFGSEAQVLDAATKRSCSVIFEKVGIYDANLKVTDRNGCSTSISKQVTIEANPVAAFNIVDNYENKQGHIMISNTTINGTDYAWDFGNGKTSSAEAPIVTFDKEGRYTIKLIAWNSKSCTDTMNMIYSIIYKGLYVPNAFNPGHMDPEVAVFRPKGTNLKSYFIQIYDRWGNLIWSSDKIDNKGSPAESWDGKLHGEVLQQGVYVWKIFARFNDGEVWDGTNIGNSENMPQGTSGTVTLIR